MGVSLHFKSGYRAIIYTSVKLKKGYGHGRSSSNAPAHVMFCFAAQLYTIRFFTCFITQKSEHWIYSMGMDFYEMIVMILFVNNTLA